MEVKEFKSFYKQVGGNEGGKCHYSTRLDTYGCGCGHDCSYCYAKSLLNFRKMWNPTNPSVADIDKIKRKINTITPGTIIRLGGMTDCFQPIERVHGTTKETIRELNDHGIGYLIVTKGAMVADYTDVMRKDLAHIQVSVTSTDNRLARTYEKADPVSERIKAIESLQHDGYDVQLRLSPFIPEYVDLDIINNVNCDKILIEFLRVNSWIQKWFDIDYSPYTVKQSGYRHRTLEDKIKLVDQITGFKEKSVCEDESEAYEYWKKYVNHNPDDCCNLRV